MKRYTTWASYPYPLKPIAEIGHYDTIEEARAAAAGYDIAFVHDHEVGNNVDGMVSITYTTRNGVSDNVRSGWQSEWQAKQSTITPTQPTFIQRMMQSWRSLWGVS